MHKRKHRLFNMIIFVIKGFVRILIRSVEEFINFFIIYLFVTIFYDKLFNCFFMKYDLLYTGSVNLSFVSSAFL